MTTSPEDEHVEPRPAPEAVAVTEKRAAGNGAETAVEALLEPPEAMPAPAPLTPRILVQSITVEVLFYALLFALSLLLRLAGLGARPLAASEAGGAVAAWDFLQGLGGATAGSPFLFSANLLTFLLTGPTDTTARLVPALIGSCAVLLPLLPRREIGRAAAAVSSILLLFSTSLVFFARNLNGLEISAVAGYAAVLWIWRFAREASRSSLYLGAIAGAVALTASPAGYTVLLSALLFLVLYVRLSARSRSAARAMLEPSDGADAIDPTEPRAARHMLRNAVVLFAAAYVALATAYLMNRPGLGEALGLLGAWLSAFQSLGPLTVPLNLLLVYEPLVLVFGLAGLLLTPGLAGEELENAGILTFFSIAAVVSLVIFSLAGDKTPANMTILVIPLAILAGWFIGNLGSSAAEEIARHGGWQTVVWGELPILAIALMLVPLVYLQLVTFLQRNTFSQGVEWFRELIAPATGQGGFEAAVLLLGIITLIIIIFLALLAIGSVGATRAANLGAGIVLLVLFASGIRSLFLANYSTVDPVNELIAAEQTSLQARDLRSDLEWESEWHANDEHAITIRADPALGPVVRWYLRGFPNVEWASQPQVGDEAQAVLTTGDAPAPPGEWVTQRYQLQVSWQLGDVSRADLIRWLVTRAGGTQTWQYVRLWVPPPTQ